MKISKPKYSYDKALNRLISIIAMLCIQLNTFLKLFDLKNRGIRPILD